MHKQPTRTLRKRKSVASPSRDDLETDLYIQLREVGRCLDRYPEELPEATRRLIDLVRQYNPELAWRTLPGDARRYERMGEP
jgi:hypothetical protein